MAQDEIRTFIAIEISNEVSKKIQKIQSELKPLIKARVSWPKCENIHLTLKFLGDVSLDKIDSIKEELKKACKRLSPLEMSLGGIGTFPNFRRPRVIWLGVNRGSQELIQLAGSVENAMKKLGFSPERRKFTPHLTLGRIRQGGINLEDIEPKLAKYNKPDIPIIKVEKFVLIKSELHPKGAIYTTLEEFSLGR